MVIVLSSLCQCSDPRGCGKAEKRQEKVGKKQEGVFWDGDGQARGRQRVGGRRAGVEPGTNSYVGS